MLDETRRAGPRLAWYVNGTGSSLSDTRRVIYRGPLKGTGLRLHYGFDGWQEPLRDAPLEPHPSGGYVAEIPEVGGHLVLDCAVTNGEDWDNNLESDYRLWLTVDPFDAHLHLSGVGGGGLGLSALRAALTSAGIAGGVASFPGNRAVAQAVATTPGLNGLVWVWPGITPLSHVRQHLLAGFVGLKFHPTVDEFPADDPEVDPYLELAAQWDIPVAIHSAPGDADPDHIRRLAERHPNVRILLYHTYLGPVEGRLRAVEHVREQPNLFLETSWCLADEILHFVRVLGPERVLFGSDASIDGVKHYCRRPPNIQGKETYNEGLLRLVRSLDPVAARLVMGDNARRFFKIRDEPAGPKGG